MIAGLCGYVLSRRVELHTWPFSIFTSLTASPMRTLHGLPSVDRIVARELAVFPVEIDFKTATCAEVFHRAVRPRFRHAGGCASSPSWLCNTSSAIAFAPPKLPSIWNGGCASTCSDMSRRDRAEA